MIALDTISYCRHLFADIAFDLFNGMDQVKERHLAEIKYKTGLCHYSAYNFDASIADLQKSVDYIQQAMDAQKKLDQTPTVEQQIDDLTKTREDIIQKIADVQEMKQEVSKKVQGKIPFLVFERD